MASGRASGVKHSPQQTRMKDNIKELMPHRLSRGERRGTFAGESLASILNKWTIVTQTIPNTSRTPGKRAGDVSLRIGTLNVGSIKGRSGDVADMVARRRLGFCVCRILGGRVVVQCHLARKELCISFYGQDVKKGWQV